MRTIHQLLVAVFVMTGCLEHETPTPPVDDNKVDTPIDNEDDAVVATDLSGEAIADADDLTGEPPDTSQDQFGLLGCSTICSVVGGALACSEFAIAGQIACGFASTAICNAVCGSVGPRSHCSSHSGGKACMNSSWFWWCDTRVDGRRVRAHYELDSRPGIVATAWAPSQGCLRVGWPTAIQTKRWRVCTEGLGCSAFFYP
jgi:hypothetical protein